MRSTTALRAAPDTTAVVWRKPAKPHISSGCCAGPVFVVHLHIQSLILLHDGLEREMIHDSLSGTSTEVLSALATGVNQACDALRERLGVSGWYRNSSIAHDECGFPH